MSVSSLGVSCGALFLCLWTTAAAANSCPIEVESGLDQNWHLAAAELRGQPEGDCGTATLKRDREGQVRLSFQTLDGRTAGRLLSSPDELTPTFLALNATAPSVASVQEASEPDTSETGRAEAEPVPEATMDDSGVTVERQSPSRIPSASSQPDAFEAVALTWLGGRGSARLLGGVGAEVEWHRWIIGLGVTEETNFGSPAVRATSVAGRAGLQVPLGDVAWRFATTACLYCQAATSGESRTEWRLGILSGLSWPQSGRVRVRPEVGIDTVPARLDGNNIDATISVHLGAELVLGTGG